MTIAYTIPTEYEFTLYYGATNSTFAASSNFSLTGLNINPDELLAFVKRQEVLALPETDGGALVTDGKIDAEPMTFFGQQFDDSNQSDGLFQAMGTRVSQMVGASQYQYIRAKLYTGSGTNFYRRYGAVRAFASNIVRKTRYRVMNTELIFDVLDPHWYLDTLSVDSVTVTSGSGSKAVTDGGNRRTSRVIIIVTKTGASNPANVQIKNASNHTITLGGSLVNVNDFWTIDMYAGTVTKSVSGVVSNDIANVTGRFWGINAASDTITVTDGGTASFSVALFWLPRRV